MWLADTSTTRDRTPIKWMCIDRLLTAMLLVALLVLYHVYFHTNYLRNHASLAALPALPGSLGTVPPRPLGSVLITAEEDLRLRGKRGIYGGVGDKPHLGGFIDYDAQGVSNNTFNFMLGPLGIKSVLDIGCGKGVSTSRFRELGAKVLCVEGSHDACTHSLLPAQLVVEHDYSRGPWWPEDTYDAAWAVEFLEHVGRQHMANYVATMRRAALVFVTHSAWGGWHHVEVHSDMWWTGRFEALGFRFSADLTEAVRREALIEAGLGHNRKPISGQHIYASMLVFINPGVAGLAEHSHLFAGYGCFNGERYHRKVGMHAMFNHGGGVPCNDTDALPGQYEALLDCRRPVSTRLPTELWSCTKNPRATAAS